MGSRSRLGVVLGCLAAISGCSAPTDSIVGLAPDEFVLSTDQPSYRAMSMGGTGPYRGYGFTVIARFTNHAESTVYLARCLPTTPFPVYGVAAIGDPEGAAYNGAWGCVGHDQQIAVAPGATRIDTLQLKGPNGVSGGVPLGAFAGQMRLVYEVQGCRGDGACRIPGAGESNLFTVTVQP